jgi:outer membrane protein TolC
MDKRHAATLFILILTCSSPALADTAPASAVPAARLTLQAAVSQALRDNLDLQIEKSGADLSGQPAVVARGPLDPVLFAETSVVGGAATAQPGGGTQLFRLKPASQSATTSSAVGVVGVRKTFVTGTSVEVGVGGARRLGESEPLSATGAGGGSGTGTGTSSKGGPIPDYAAGAYATVSQHLLRGSSIAANMAPITVAELKEKSARAGLSRKADLVAQDTVKAYWDLQAAQASLAIQKLGLDTADRTLKETHDLVAAGRVPRADEVQAAYPVEVARRAVVDAERTVANARDKLARLMGVLSPAAPQAPELVLDATPSFDAADPALDPEQLRDEALSQRADLAGLKLDLKARNVDAGAAKHALLPQLDLNAGASVLTLGSSQPSAITASAASATGMVDPGAAATSSVGVGWSVGLSFAIPLGNSEARGRKELADLAVRQADLGVARAQQQITEEVNGAARAVVATRKQLEVSQEAAHTAETKYQNELERFRAGRSTAFVVANMHADWLKEQTNLASAQADVQKALTDLWTSTGTLLPRLGLA